MTREQKFHNGDLVHIAKDLGPDMSHFTSDVDAIVIGSYSDQYGGRSCGSYTLYLKDGGQVSWYEESQLTLIESGKEDLLEKWKEERAAKKKVEADLDWIFSHGKEVLEGASGATVGALAEQMGVTDLWGSRGEGLDYYFNASATLQIAGPFLENNDKEGFLHMCEEVQSGKKPQGKQNDDN